MPTSAPRYYKSSNRIAIGIADAGIGVRETIGVSHRVTDDASAIRLALQPGITGTTSRIGGTEFNAGAGLFFTKSIAALGRNIFVLASGANAFKLLPGRESKQLKLFPDPMEDSHRFLDIPRWQDTVVGIDVSVREDVEFAKLLSEIRKAYKIDVSKSRKDYYKKIRFAR